MGLRSPARFARATSSAIIMIKDSSNFLIKFAIWRHFLNFFDIKITRTANLYCALVSIKIKGVSFCLKLKLKIKDSLSFPINDLRSDVIFINFFDSKDFERYLGVLFRFLRTALNLIAHYWCFVYATCWSLCYQISIVNYFNTSRLLLSFNPPSRKILHAAQFSRFSMPFTLQSPPTTRHKQTSDFAINRLRRDVRLCFSAFIACLLCNWCLSLFFFFLHCVFE